ncbi:MAG: flagellar biosynthetic protein FliR [Planctomycetota bacterium]
MNQLVSEIPEFWVVFALVCARLSGIVALMPTPTGRNVSIAFRAVLVLCMATLLTPLASAGFREDVTLRWLGETLATETAVGLLLGSGIHLLILGLQVSGQLVSQMGGISLAGVYSHGAASVSPVTRLMDLLAVAVFLLMGGHRVVVHALLRTFADWPPGHAVVSMSTAQVVGGLLTESFLLGIEAALPIVATLFVSNILAAMLGRMMPQMNVLLLSSGLNSLLLFAAMFVGVGAMAWTLQDHLEPFVMSVTRLCGG